MSAPQTARGLITGDATAVRGHVFGQRQHIPRASIVGFASARAEGVSSGCRSKPDVVVLEIQAPHGSGLEILRDIRLGGSEPLTIVSTNLPLPQYRRRTLAPGAGCFMETTTDSGVLKDLLAQFNGVLETVVRN